MPIYKEIFHENARILIWKITEDENFFLDQIKIDCDIKHPKRRIEYIVGRYLLQMMTPEIDLNLIKKNESGKPYSDDYDFSFSISHSYPYVTVGILYLKEIGVDIQVFGDKIMKVKDKFLSNEEQLLCKNNVQMFNLFWNVKEAVYKWIGTGGQTFKEDFQIKKITKDNNQYKILTLVKINENDIVPKEVIGRIFSDCSLAYIVDNEVD